MPKISDRPYSRYSRQAALLLGRLIRSARMERKMTAMEVSERAKISRGLLQRIEKGEMASEIGAVFEVATIVGVPLFEADEPTLNRHRQQIEDRLTLLPKSARKKKAVVNDDF